MRWWTATPSRRELVIPIFLLNTWEHYIQLDSWKLDFWALFCDTRPIYSPLALLEARIENSPASEPLQQTNGTVSGRRAFLVPSAKATTVPNLSRSSVWGANYYLDLLPAKAKSSRCKSTKWFVRGWKPAAKIFTLLGRARNISDLADSFTWASIDMAVQLHSCGTSHWQNDNHHACIAREWQTLFSQRLWIWAALYCKGFDNSTSRKYDEHSTSRHSKHTPREGSLSSELVCLRNKSGSFQ